MEDRKPPSRLHRFVAWSLLLHAGAAIAWVVPALFALQADHELRRAVADMQRQRTEAVAAIRHQVAEEAKRKTREQIAELVRKQVEERLTRPLSEEVKQDIVATVQEKLSERIDALAEAVNRPGTDIADLQLAERELRRDAVEALAERLNQLAKGWEGAFLETVDRTVVPHLTAGYKQAVREQVAGELLRQAEQVAKAQGANEAAARRELKEFAAGELKAAAEKQFLEEFNGKTLDRVLGRLESELRRNLAEDGIKSDDAAIKGVIAKARESLASKVPAGVRAGDELAAKMGGLVREKDAKGGEPAAAGTEQRREMDAGKRAMQVSLQGLLKQAGEQAGGPKDDLGLDAAKLASASRKSREGAQRARKTKKGEHGGEEQDESGESQGGSAANTSRDGSKRARGTPSLGADERKQIASLAEDAGQIAQGMRNGRIDEAGSSAIAELIPSSGVRSATGRPKDGASTPANQSAGSTAAAADGDGKEFESKAAAMMAKRGQQRGGRWTEGTEGAASRAERESTQVPAQIVDFDNAKARPDIAGSAPYAPAFDHLAFGHIPRLPESFTIDGSAEKWAAVPTLTLKPERFGSAEILARNPEAGKDASVQRVQLGWNAKGLFGRFTVIDPDRSISKCKVWSFWEGDTIELWLDNANMKATFRDARAGQQFWLWPEGSASDASLTGGEVFFSAAKDGAWEPRGLRMADLPRVTTKTPTGYVLEFQLRADRLANADFYPGRIIGFNANVETWTGTSWYWASGRQRTGTYALPNTWGDLLLSGSDATIELIEQPGLGGNKALLPGEPLKLRVTDADMNLSPLKRDKVMVMLNPGIGRQQMVICEETGSDSGVFEGAVKTVLSIGEDLPGVLAVYEGGKVEATYIDQARANGARNSQIRLPLRFSAVLAARVGLGASPPRP